MRIARPLATLLFAALTMPGAAPALAGVGLVPLQVHEPTTGTRMPAMLFHPTAQQTGITEVGPYRVHAAFAAQRPQQRHPLVLVSHGHGGSALGHHPLATALANAGYVVAAIEHAGDSHADQSGFGTERVLLGRAWQISSLLDTLLQDPQLAAMIDPQRIGVAGFSAGGHTSLVLLGAVPDLRNRERYCQKQPQDLQLCLQPAANAPALNQYRALSDPRIRAAFVMAPLGVFFDQPALRAVTRPVFVHAAMADSVLLPRWNALAVREGVAALAGWRGVVGADHHVYLAPCPAAMAHALPELCVDAAGINRRDVQAQLAADAVAFFNDTLAAQAEGTTSP